MCSWPLAVSLILSDWFISFMSHFIICKMTALDRYFLVSLLKFIVAWKISAKLETKQWDWLKKCTGCIIWRLPMCQHSRCDLGVMNNNRTMRKSKAEGSGHKNKHLWFLNLDVMSQNHKVILSWPTGMARPFLERGADALILKVWFLTGVLNVVLSTVEVIDFLENLIKSRRSTQKNENMNTCHAA